MKKDYLNDAEAEEAPKNPEQNAASMQNLSRMKTRRVVALAVFSALSYVLMMFVKLDVTSFLTLDVKDAVITVAAAVYGAHAGPLLSLAVALLEMITISKTGFYGFLMNFAGSASFSFVGAFLIRKIKGRRGFFIGLPLAVFSMTVVMIFMNLLVTPLYTGATVQAVLSMIAPVLLPFNLAKGILNAVIAAAVYPVIYRALRRAHLFTDAPVLEKFTKRETVLFVLVLLCACLMATALLIFIQ